MKAIAAALVLIVLQHSWALTPTDCNAIEPVAGKVLDLVNKVRWDGYIFQLLRVADAHLDKAESPAVYYLVLDVQESDCLVLSRKHWDECKPAVSRRPSEIVIGQCKVIAIKHSSESQDLRVNDFNCTTSSVSSALANTKDSPVLMDFFEDTEPYQKQADKALEKYIKENEDFTSFRVDQVERVARVRGEERTNYYLDFSVRNCSRHRFPRHSNIFGFCRALLSYDAGASDLETPKDLEVNCEVFNLEEHRNFSGRQPHPGGHEHSPAGSPPFKPSRIREQPHPHGPHEFGCPPPLEDEDHPGGAPVQAGGPPPLPPSGPRCHQAHVGKNRTHDASEHHPQGLRPHGHRPHRYRPHGYRPHGPHPHGPHPHGPHPHGPHPHGPHPHGPHPHGPHPHEPHPHGPHPHGPHPHGPHGPHPHGPHPLGHDFRDHGPCDPPEHSKAPHDQHRHGYGPPPGHSEERGPDKRHFLPHWKYIGYVYRLPPLKQGEVLPPPEANFPSFPPPNHNKPEIQPFPQSASDSCPGKFKIEFPQVLKFFASVIPK